MTMHYTLELLNQDTLVCHVCPGRPNHAGQVHPYFGSLKSLLMSPERKVSPEDRRLLMRLMMLQPLNTSYYALTGKNGMTMLRELIATGRCFWASAQNRPLAWGPDRAASAGWKLDKLTRQKLVTTCHRSGGIHGYTW